MELYLDKDFKIHVSPADGLTPFETDCFDGKCDVYIEGYRFVPEGEMWTREDGAEFSGEMIAPWKDWQELDAAQREYEREQLALLKAQNTDMQAALKVLGITNEETET